MAYQKITINDKEMEFKASGATPVVFKHVFNTDLLRYMRKWEKEAEKKAAEEEAKEKAKEKASKTKKTSNTEKSKENPKEKTAAEIEQEEIEATETIDIISKLGFVMAMQAETERFSDLGKLNYESYLEWLDRFDNISDIPFEVIMEVYYNNETTEVDEKNQVAEPSEN